MWASYANLISSLFLQEELERVVANALAPRHIKVEGFVHDVHEIVHAGGRQWQDSVAGHLRHTELSEVEQWGPLLNVPVKEHHLFHVGPQEHNRICAVFIIDEVWVKGHLSYDGANVYNECGPVVLIPTVYVDTASLDKFEAFLGQIPICAVFSSPGEVFLHFDRCFGYVEAERLGELENFDVWYILRNFRVHFIQNVVFHFRNSVLLKVGKVVPPSVHFAVVLQFLSVSPTVFIRRH